MGADIIGWRNCPLQRNLGAEGFLRKLKLRAYRAAIESRVPVAERSKIKLRVQVAGRGEEEMSYGDIVEQLQAFEAGIPECGSCMIGGGKQLGCYRYVQYPVDAAFEQLVFDFFVEELKTKDSIGDQIYRDVVSKQPSAGTAWHQARGTPEQGGLAQRPQPLKHSFGGFFSKQKVDSAQMLASLFITVDNPAAVVGYARLFNELVSFAKKRNVSAEASPTLAQLQEIAPMYLATAAIALTEGGGVLVDG